jgi:hypothetical protein
MRTKLLNCPFIEALLTEDKIKIIDGGARGKILAPFDMVTPLR